MGLSASNNSLCRVADAHDIAIRPRRLQHIREEFKKHAVPTLRTQLHQREAFRAIFSFGGTVEALDANQVISNRKSAIKNAHELAGEIVAMLRQEMASALVEEVADVTEDWAAVVLVNPEISEADVPFIVSRQSVIASGLSCARTSVPSKRFHAKQKACWDEAVSWVSSGRY